MIKKIVYVYRSSDLTKNLTQTWEPFVRFDSESEAEEFIYKQDIMYFYKIGVIYG